MNKKLFDKLICGTMWLAICSQTFAANEDHARAKHSTWSGYWWPLREGAMLGPLAKYDLITVGQAARWEREHHAASESTPKWHGYCHGWAASAVLEKEPTRTIMVTTPAGKKIKLSVGDQKGLLAACHTLDIANVYGDRFGDGVGSDDPNDIAPDELWRLLQLYVKNQQVPLIVDIESGDEVWNYPIIAYRIKHQPAERNWHVGTMTLLMADNGVQPNFVGLKVRRHHYRFQFRMLDGVVVAGSGKWIGPSKTNHPDFAWYPFVARPENPELDYSKVARILHHPASLNSSNAVDSNVPASTATNSTTTNDVSGNTAPNNVSPANSSPANTVASGTNEQERERVSEDSTTDEASNVPNQRLTAAQSRNAQLLSPLELAALVMNRTSDFAVDVTVDRFDGGEYKAGDPLQVRVSSGQAGRLYLFRVDPNGNLSQLFPMPKDDNHIAAIQSISIPLKSSGYKFAAAGPTGINRIKAIITSKPIVLTGLQTASVVQQSGNRHITSMFRWNPTQRAQIQQWLSSFTRNPEDRPASFPAIDVKRILGEFAQDEVVFYVRK